VVKQMLERRVILNATDETVVRFLPPYLITKKHVDAAILQLEQVLAGRGSGRTGQHRVSASSDSLADRGPLGRREKRTASRKPFEKTGDWKN
jgi:hypothetical protein